MKGNIKNTLTGCSHPSRIGSHHVGDQVVCHQGRTSNSKSRSSSRLFCRYHRQAKECKNQRGQEECICLVLAEVWAVETVFRTRPRSEYGHWGSIYLPVYLSHSTDRLRNTANALVHKYKNEQLYEYSRSQLSCSRRRRVGCSEECSIYVGLVPVEVSRSC